MSPSFDSSVDRYWCATLKCNDLHLQSPSELERTEYKTELEIRKLHPVLQSTTWYVQCYCQQHYLHWTLCRKELSYFPFIAVQRLCSVLIGKPKSIGVLTLQDKHSSLSKYSGAQETMPKLLSYCASPLPFRRIEDCINDSQPVKVNFARARVCVRARACFSVCVHACVINLCYARR